MSRGDAETRGHVDAVGVNRHQRVRHRLGHEPEAEVVGLFRLQRGRAVVLRNRAANRIGADLNLIARHEGGGQDLVVGLARRRRVEARADRSADREAVEHLVEGVQLADRGAAEGAVVFVTDGEADAQLFSDVGFCVNVDAPVVLIPGSSRLRAGAAVAARSRRQGVRLAGRRIDARRDEAVEVLRHGVGSRAVGLQITRRLLVLLLAVLGAAGQHDRAEQAVHIDRIAQVDVEVGFLLGQLAELEARLRLLAV